MKRKTRKHVAAGDELRIVANVGIRNDDDSSVPSVELRGMNVVAAGTNCNYQHADTGEDMVGCQLENGYLTSIPRAALKHTRVPGGRVGSTSRFRAAYDAIFG